MSGQRIAANQRGVALVTSLLLLLIITILALSMFRSFGTQERIAGNLREKERALHAADSAQQYAEWWLLQGNNTAAGAVACAAGLAGGDPDGGTDLQPDPDALYAVQNINVSSSSLAGRGYLYAPGHAARRAASCRRQPALLCDPRLLDH